MIFSHDLDWKCLPIQYELSYIDRVGLVAIKKREEASVPVGGTDFFVSTIAELLDIPAKKSGLLGSG